MKEFILCNERELFGDCDSATIQNAIDAAEKDGCRKVVIPRYNLRTDKTEWRISKAIELPSEMTIILDNCYMVQETGVFDNMFKNSLAHTIEPRTLENEQHDISIIGVGNVRISGGVHNGLLERTSRKWGLLGTLLNNLFYWVNVRNLRVENLHIEHQRHWAMNHIYCRNVTLKNIDFYAIPHVPNMDGIDLRLGCNNFEIENITGRTGDDTIALTAMSGFEAELAVEGKSPDICDVNIKNVLSDANRMLNVRLLAQDGNQVRDINIDTVMDTSDWASKAKGIAPLGIGTQGALYVKVCRAKQEDCRSITAKHLYSRASQVVRLDDVCSDSTFTNLKTFNTCFVALSTCGFGTTLKNVVVDSLYCGSMRSDNQKGLVDGYTPFTVALLPETKGEILIKNINSDGISYLCDVNDELDLTFENCPTENVDKLYKNLGKAKLTVNGKEYSES